MLLPQHMLDDFISISNLTANFALNNPTDQRAPVCILARFSLLLLGADTLTPTIISKLWGQNQVVHCNLGRSRGSLALTYCWLISLASVANNPFHLWLVAHHHLQWWNNVGI